MTDATQRLIEACELAESVLAAAPQPPKEQS
jgi:hypothetical protein